MIRSVLSHCRTPAIVLLLCATASLPAAAELDTLGALYRPDAPFPEFTCFWSDSGQRELQLRGQAAMEQAGKEPQGGSIHLFLRNTAQSSVTIQDVLLEGVSLKRAVAFSEQGKLRENLHAASIHFSDLPAAERDRLISAGEPIWWKVDPQPIPAGGTAEVVVRLRLAPGSKTLRLGLEHADGIAESAVPIHATQTRMESISFSPAVDTVFLYLRHPVPGKSPSRILMDGQDVTSLCAIGRDAGLDTVPVVCKLNDPLARASFHCFQAVYPDGTTATGGLRAWADEIAYGIWGAKPGKESEVELARSYVKELHEHNINVQMEMVGSAAVSAFLKSDEGLSLLSALGIRRMVNDPGKGNTRAPSAYFLTDEPDAADFRTEGLEPNKRVGSLAQGLVQRSAALRKADPVTPHLLNVDTTFKPDNWYVYGQLPDIFATDPYYQERLRQAYWDQPWRVPIYAKATFIYAVSSVSQSACAPKPLHLILNSVRRTKKDKQFRFATPEEKRIEVYYALAAGAKEISYWWYTPVPPSYGCGGPEPEAVALWREIGLLGAEVRTAGSIISRSCPAVLPVTAPSKLWVRCLLAGLDTLVILCVNDNYLNDRLGTVIKPVGNADVSVGLPSWMDPKTAFEVNSGGTQDVRWELSGSRLNLKLGTVDVTRMIVVATDPELRTRLQTLYEGKFADNVAKLTGGEGDK